MMWLLLVVGCASWGPRSALKHVDHALEASNRAELEQAVDVDAVVPEMAAVCARLAARDGLEEEQFRPAVLVDGFGRELADQQIAAWLADPSQTSQVVQAFRASFPVLPVDRCPALSFHAADAELTAVDAQHWTATVDPGWVFEVDRVDGAWRVVDANGDALVGARERDALSKAHDLAEERVGRLGVGSSPDEWEALRSYGERHPTEDVAGELAKKLAPLESAPSLAPVVGTSFYMPNGLIPVRHVATEVELRAPARELVVRFALADPAGKPVTSGGGTRAVIVKTGPADAGVVRVATRAGEMNWPKATLATATVVEVTWADGTVERHPAVEAGAWSALPNSDPHGM